ncbi:MAG: redoxin domain-containing protein [Alphaproteobacteria bacterium]|nr:redoxin domain-containing protein [Alphaproteobacteria bacterium]
MTKNPLVAALEETTAEAMASSKPLDQRLQMIANRVRALSPEFASAVDAFVGRLVGAEAGATAPAMGDRFPGFVLPDQAGRLVSLDALLQDGPVVVAFLRGHWCPYCRLTAGALSEIADTARALGARIVAITPEGRKFIRQLDADTRGAFPILADVDNGFALSANLGIWVDESMASLIAGAGWDIPAYQGNAAWILPIPAIFTLNREGIVIARHVNPDYRERANLDDILGALGALA